MYKQEALPVTGEVAPMHACAISVQATGEVPDSDSFSGEGALRGLVLIGDVDLDREGARLPWPLPAMGFGNAAHLAKIAISSSGS
jgi:hypothetical protein